MKKYHLFLKSWEGFILLLILIFFNQVGNTQSFQLVKDIRPGSQDGFTNGSSQILENQATFNGKVYFSGNDGTGTTLWVTDGTEAGTQKITTSPQPQSPRFFATMNDKFYFITSGASVLWESDGTGVGTKGVAQISTSSNNTITNNNFITTFDGKLYFFGYDDTNGKELWISDGTPTGTKLLKDINPGTGDSNPANMTIFKGKIYFTANDGTNEIELWMTDGTEAGTQLVKDISTSGSASPSDLVVFNDQLFFASFSTSLLGREIWVSDGTEEGTNIFKNINSTNFTSSSPSGFKVAESKLFFTANNGTNGFELWVSDGTEAGTQLVKDINPGGGNSTILHLTQVGDKVFFRADDGTNGKELWVSDGTEAGTQLVKDIATNVDGGIPFSLTAFNNKIYFVARDNSFQTAVWVSDGTETGTTQFTSSPTTNFIGGEQMFVSGNKLYYAPDNSSLGYELWIYEVPVQNQSITFSLDDNATKMVGDATFELSATGGGSGNPIIFTSSDESVATISGTTVTIVGVGTTTITASQAGNDFYNAAIDVTQTLTVNIADSGEEGDGSTVTSISDLENNAISVYPNPTEDNITVENLPLGKTTFILVDVIGNEIYVGETAESLVLDLSVIPSGVYTLTLNTSKGIFTRKIIKN